MASSPATVPQSSATANSIYLALEGLKTKAAESFLDYEDDGDLDSLRDSLGTLRDRADAIQNAVLGTIAAINSHL